MITPLPGPGPVKRQSDESSTTAIQALSGGGRAPKAPQPNALYRLVVYVVNWVLGWFSTKTNLPTVLLKSCERVPLAYQDQAKQLINKLPSCDDAVVKSIKALTDNQRVCLIVGLLTDSIDPPQKYSIKQALQKESFNPQEVFFELRRRFDSQENRYQTIINQCSNNPYIDVIGKGQQEALQPPFVQNTGGINQAQNNPPTSTAPEFDRRIENAQEHHDFQSPRDTTRVRSSSFSPSIPESIQSTAEGRQLESAQESQEIHKKTQASLLQLIKDIGETSNLLTQEQKEALQNIVIPSDSTDAILRRITALPPNAKQLFIWGLSNSPETTIQLFSLENYTPESIKQLFTMKDTQGNSPLHIALSQANPDHNLIFYLLDNGCDPTEQNEKQQTGLDLIQSLDVLKSTCPETQLRTLIKNISNKASWFTGTDKEKLNTIVLPECSLGALKQLLTSNKTSQELLVWGVLRQYFSKDLKPIDSTKKLIDTIDADGKTPLHHAISTGSTSTVQAFLEQGAALDLKDLSGHTPLNNIQEGMREIGTLQLDQEQLKRLSAQISQTRLPEALSKADQSAIQTAASSILPSCSLQLLQQLQQLDAPTQQLLALALLTNPEGVRKVLETSDLTQLSHKLLALTDDQENSLLHRSVANGYVAITRFLLDQGANRYALNAAGKTPLGLTRSKNMIALLPPIEELKPILLTACDKAQLLSDEAKESVKATIQGLSRCSLKALQRAQGFDEITKELIIFGLHAKPKVALHALLQTSETTPTSALKQTPETTSTPTLKTIESFKQSLLQRAQKIPGISEENKILARQAIEKLALDAEEEILTGRSLGAFETLQFLQSTPVSNQELPIQSLYTRPQWLQTTLSPTSKAALSTDRIEQFKTSLLQFTETTTLLEKKEKTSVKTAIEKLAKDSLNETQKGLSFDSSVLLQSLQNPYTHEDKASFLKELCTSSHQQLQDKLSALPKFLPPLSRDEISKHDSIADLIHFKDKDGNTPLHAAISRGSFELAQKLVDLGANISSHNRKGLTPDQCSQSGPPSLNISSEFMKSEISSFHANTPLTSDEQLTLMANLNHLPDTCSLKALRQLQDLDKRSQQLLLWGLCTRPIETIQLFLSEGLNTLKFLNMRDSEGNTPLHRAISYKLTETAASFVELGADVNVRNNQGNTPCGLIQKQAQSIELLELTPPSEQLHALLSTICQQSTLLTSDERNSLSTVIKSLPACSINVLDRLQRLDGPSKELLAWGLFTDPEATKQAMLSELHTPNALQQLISLKDGEGNTPLHRAINNVDLATAFVSLGADHEAINAQHQTAGSMHQTNYKELMKDINERNLAEPILKLLISDTLDKKEKLALQQAIPKLCSRSVLEGIATLSHPQRDLITQGLLLYPNQTKQLIFTQEWSTNAVQKLEAPLEQNRKAKALYDALTKDLSSNQATETWIRKRIFPIPEGSVDIATLTTRINKCYPAERKLIVWGLLHDLEKTKRLFFSQSFDKETAFNELSQIKDLKGQSCTQEES